MKPSTLLMFILSSFLLSKDGVAEGSKEQLLHARIGLGYSFVEGTNIVDSKLPRWSAINEPTRTIPNLPLPCFKEPGITSISGVETKRGQVPRLLEIWVTANVRPEVECGENKEQVDVFIEAKSDAGKWYILNNPSDDLLNSYAVEWATYFNKKETHSFAKKHDEVNSIEYFRREGERAFVFSVLDGKFGLVLDLNNSEEKQDVDKMLKLAGFKVYPANTKYHKYRSAIYLGDVDAENFYSSLRRNYSRAFIIDGAALQVSVRRMEFSFGDEYDPNWLKKIANNAEEQMR